MTAIRTTQPLAHRLVISNLPATSDNIAKLTAEGTIEHLLVQAGISVNEQPVFFQSHEVLNLTGLSDPPQSRYKALNTDYFEIIGPKDEIEFTSKIFSFLNNDSKPYYPSSFESELVDENNHRWPRLFAHFTDVKENDEVRWVHLAFDSVKHSGKESYDTIERAPEEAIRKAIKAHLDKHFEDMKNVPAESCISVTNDSGTRGDQCKVLFAVRMASAFMVDKITATKDRSTLSAKVNIPMRPTSRLTPQVTTEPLLVEQTITGVFKRIVKTRGMREPFAIVVLWAKSNRDPQSVASYLMSCLKDAETRHAAEYPQDPITRPKGTIVTTDYEPATGPGQHQKAVFRFSVSTSALATHIVQMVPFLPAHDRFGTSWHDGDERVVIKVCLDNERADAISARFNKATSESQGAIAESARHIENRIDMIQDVFQTLATTYAEDKRRNEQIAQETRQMMHALHMSNQALFSSLSGVQASGQAQFAVMTASTQLSNLRMELLFSNHPKDSQEYQELAREVQEARRTVCDAQAAYQQTQHQVTLALRQASPVYLQQLAHDGPTIPNGNNASGAADNAMDEREESGGSPSKRGRHNQEGDVHTTSPQPQSRSEHEGMSIDS
ncbi:BZ3500_MvSof-1268-A1-R1_Chr1-3g02462 [Microbotryum saponariae]|uniref:BZ3500_MvSof-1268-A1-R1_Chr1-3g02462 protein n=2 Tax=Microbotryum saponariae TaxID=289078 RepID=A0A2X0KDI6_9BASI|nr:BZ3500_MvSof-1268-A1-R1_Chr1-3g02462 [Microbotryum saponariae]SCZ96298.1 BZ3501_MvSof-1269-A2-R1_Chr1-3g02065 [Microbotryum saponariae]